ncbi:MAG TPA: PLP-dependent aminotransferase family protein [Acetobacteraceae bacterium]|nr:PLP-dependent aminotransferase family protein [Acetobacteraceae bacterium]
MPNRVPSSQGLSLDRSTAVPVHRQIYQWVRDAVGSGTLGAGERLPSARGLAAQLGVARGTVDAAYALLIGEGYVVTRGPAGSIISPNLASAVLPRRAPRPMLLHPAGAAPSSGVPLLRLGVPALDAFPRKLWCRLSAHEARRLTQAAMSYPDPAGHQPLREAIAAYLAVSRGIVCAPDQIIVTAGYQGALALIARLRLRPGDRVWLEDPGYFLSRQALALAGAGIVAVGVDADGLCVTEGEVLAPDARLAVVTPSHQSPLGMTLSLPRRLALLAWASAAGGWIVEDDYDSEYRYSGPPSPALKSLDAHDRVLYAGSFSKVLMPGLRLGYLVVPESQVAAFADASRLSDGGQPVLPQSVVARFMAEGHFARHLRRMRALYAERRAALAAALVAQFGEQLSIELQAGGMHLIARLPVGADDVALSSSANAAGLAVEPLSPAAVAHACGPGFVLGFTNVPVEAAAGAARRLREAIPRLAPR